MFQGFTPKAIEFMWNLRLNNERAWFEANRDAFNADYLAPMRALGAEVFARVTDAHGELGFVHKVSRIYRDARRLRGEGPYRDHLWFSLERPSEEWTATPVFWFQLSPENWSYGLGYYQARPATMAKLRARIDRAPERFAALVAPLAAQDEFVLDGPEYARAKPAPSDAVAPWYNKKSFSLIHEQPNGDELYSPALADRLVEGYAFLMPYYEYFITLDGDPAPGE